MIIGILALLGGKLFLSATVALASYGFLALRTERGAQEFVCHSDPDPVAEPRGLCAQLGLVLVTRDRAAVETWAER